jgi:7-carboxy-7-deazaguanine synthase
LGEPAVIISEIYKSIQGEGLLTGTPSIFIRTSGCNLRCWYCDTPFTSWQPQGRDLSIEEIVAQCDEWDCPHVVVTGGEPMLWSEMVPLCTELRRGGRHITIETAGTLDLPVVCDLMSISPKRPGSAPDAARFPRWHRRHEQTRHAPHVIRRLIADYEYQFKFVIDTPADCQDVLAYLAALPQLERDRVLLMPQGTDPAELARRAEWLIAFCHTAGLRYCPRKQIEWFGLVRGT